MAALRACLRHYRLLSTSTTKTTTTTTNPVQSKAVIPINLSPDHFYTDKDSWNTVHNLKRFRKFDKIESYIQSLKENPKITTDEGYLSSLIRYYGIAGMYTKALKLYNEMEVLGTPRSTLSFNALLSAYIFSKRFGDVRKLFDEMPQKFGFFPDKLSYTYLIKSLCELGSVEPVMLILKDMEEKNMKVDTVHYCMVLNALYIKGMNEEAEKLWKEMTEKGCLNDVVAYNVRIAHTEKGKPEDILVLMEEMKARGLEPDITTYNYLFSCYSRKGMLEEASRVYDDLGKNGCVPNGATYRSLIAHLCKNKDFDRAYEVFKESLLENKTQSFSTLKKLVEGLAKSSKRKEAKELIDTMRHIHKDKLSNDWNKLEAGLGLNEDEDDITVQPEGNDDECNDGSKVGLRVAKASQLLRKGGFARKLREFFC